MAYLEWMKSINVFVAGEFLVTAATLANITSWMLLAYREEGGNDVQALYPQRAEQASSFHGLIPLRLLG